MRRIWRCGAAAILAVWAGAAQGEAPTPRPGPADGAVISRVAGETVRFVDEPDFRGLLLGQDLLGGDLVRTGATGVVGIRFADRTVMRLHPNSELEIRRVTVEAAELGLNVGALWARADRGAAAVTVTTPTAAAAIRGTDWALSVERDGVTRLSVYDGAVALSNAFGSVEAGAGQQAVAEPGRAPFLVQVANRREAAQMLFAAPFAAAVGPVDAAARDAAGPAAGPGAAGYAAGLAAMRAGRFAEAAARLERAAPGLGPEHAASARWIAAFARAEAGEPLAPPPSPPGAEGLAAGTVGQAYLAAATGDLDGAAATLAAGPETPATLAAQVSVALYRDDAEGAAAALARLQAIAPGSTAAILAEAELAAAVAGDYARAAALLDAALAREPGDPDILNDIGLARDALDHPIEAEAAFRAAVAAAPADPVAAGNLLILLLDQNRLAEARALVEQTLARDPGSYLGLRAAGRLAIQEGRDAAAVETLLDALAAQPAAAETSIMLAVAAWQAGDRARAAQELDAAARLDPNEPAVPLIRTVIALDEARADDAIRSAREATRLYQQLGGGGLDRVAADRRSGSALFDAFDNLSLEGWARDVADRTFDPLSANSLATEAQILRPSLGEGGPTPSPIGAGSVIQALLIDPLAASGRLRDRDILRRPFLDAEIGGLAGFGDRKGWGAGFNLEAFSASPTPVAVAAAASGETFDVEDANGTGAGFGLDPQDGESGARSATALVGFAPSARFGGFAFLGFEGADADESDGGFLQPGFDDQSVDAYTGSLGFSWRLAGRQLLSVYGAASLIEQDTDSRRTTVLPGGVARVEIDAEDETDAQFLAASWRAADAQGFWIAGVEGGRTRSRTDSDLTITDLLTGNAGLETSRADETTLTGRAYLDRRQRLSDTVEGEAALAVIGTDAEDGSDLRLAPRAGLSWRPASDQFLRVAALYDDEQALQSLAPFTVVGLAPLAAPIAPEGGVSGVIARWDGAFGDRLHLNLEHQQLWFEELGYDAGVLLPVEIPEARLGRTELRADLWIGGGFGAFATLAYADSEITDGDSDGQSLPGLPDWSGSAGLTWVHPWQIRATVEGVWLDQRYAGFAEEELDAVATANASLGWEPFDKRLALSVEARNLFDAEIERPFGQAPFGRSVFLSAAIRF